MKKLAVGILVVIMLLSLFGCGKKAPEDERTAAATKFVHAVFVGGSEELLECVHPKLYADTLTRWRVSSRDYNEQAEMEIEITVTGEITACSASEINHKREDISDMLGEYFPIEDMCVVPVTISGRTSDGDEETREWDVYVAKVDGAWYALYMS